jgi:hypothetical protein
MCEATTKVFWSVADFPLTMWLESENTSGSSCFHLIHGFGLISLISVLHVIALTRSVCPETPASVEDHVIVPSLATSVCMKGE